MKILKSVLAFAFVLGAVVSTVSKASASVYVLQGAMTDLWDPDVDYFSTPITLQRVKNTFPLHELDFNVLSYHQVCVAYQQVCVARDSRGNCTAWENQCVQWDYQTTPVAKRIELDFRGLPALGENEEEDYQLTIQRSKPAGDGEDWVTTWLTDVKTKAPVKIIKWGDFHYEIDLKK